MNISPVTLRGRYIQLEPLSLDHIDDLNEANSEPETWKYMLYGSIVGRDKMAGWVEDILGRASKGTEMPFAVRDIKADKVIGATRYFDIRAKDRGLEIGGTWYSPAYRRTYVNTEAKYLLLRHAFEVMGCIRVQLKTDSRNARAIEAIKRIGAIQEGILRNHLILDDGIFRNSVFFSIIESDWPKVKADLESKLYSAQ